MKILFADQFPRQQMDELQAHGNDCVLDPELTAEQLLEKVVGIDALVVRSTKVTSATIMSADRLKIIVRAGAGTNTIDMDAATARGIYVCNVPGKNAIAVAELTMGLIIAIDRNIPDNVF